MSDTSMIDIVQMVAATALAFLAIMFFLVMSWLGRVLEESTAELKRYRQRRDAA